MSTTRLARDLAMNDQIDSDFVVKRRKRLGKSQEQICIENDIQRGWLSEIERGIQRKRSPEAIKKLADALGVTPDELFRGIKSLADCRRDYVQWENGLLGDHVLVRCIGLDMANGWESVVRSINATVADQIRLEFLVIFDPEETMIYQPPTFRMWTSQSSANIALIKSSIATWNPESKSRIEICFKGYAETPDLHGIIAKKSGNSRMWITRCEPIDGPEASGFTWGEDGYRILENPTEDNLRAEEFSARFERLWSSSSHTLIDEIINSPKPCK